MRYHYGSKQHRRREHKKSLSRVEVRIARNGSRTSKNMPVFLVFLLTSYLVDTRGQNSVGKVQEVVLMVVRQKDMYVALP